MLFITRCWKNARIDCWLRAGLLWLALACMGMVAQAQGVTEITQFRAERVEDGVQLSAQIQFALPDAVEDALLKGIPMYFVQEAEVLRERWYWYDKKVVLAERQLRLAYQPLTRRWRLTATSGPRLAGGTGVSLSQTFDSLAQALTGVQRVAGWRIAASSELEAGQRHRVDLRFRLDLGQLPRPFQIGALGQSDWDVMASASTVLEAAP